VRTVSPVFVDDIDPAISSGEFALSLGFPGYTQRIGRLGIRAKNTRSCLSLYAIGAHQLEVDRHSFTEEMPGRHGDGRQFSEGYQLCLRGELYASMREGFSSLQGILLEVYQDGVVDDREMIDHGQHLP
jgi:hypothetical protein